MSGPPGSTFYNEADASAQFALEQALLINVYDSLHAAGMVSYQSEQITTIEEGSVNDTALMNKLTWVPGAFEFMDLTPDQIAQLVPQIRIYKQLYNEDGSLGDEIEFVIPSKINTDILLSDTTDQGVGIKNFQYKYVGSNPATVRNDIEAKLTLYFQNFSELLRERRAPDGETKYSFLDLFERSRKLLATGATSAPPGSESDIPERTVRFASEDYDGGPYDPDRILTKEAQDYSNMVSDFEAVPERGEYMGPIEFEIKVVVGWAPPEGYSTLSFEQKEAIKNCSQAFFLTLIDHDFSFGQDGTFSLELNYRARLGAILESPQLDILRLDVEEEFALGGGRARTWLDISGLSKIFEGGSVPQVISQLEKDLKAAKYSCDHEAVKFIQDRLNRLLDEMRSDSFQSFVHFMVGTKRMYAEYFSSTTLNAWANTPNSVDAEGRDPYGGRGRGGTGGRSMSGGTGLEVVEGEVVDMDEAATLLTPTAAVDEGYFWDTSVSSDVDARLEKWEEALGLPQELDFIRDRDGVRKGKRVMYFLLGDMLYYFMLKAKRPSTDPSKDGISQQDLEKIKVLLGNCTFSTDTYSIANIPISYLAFRNFWYKRVIKPRRDTYPLLQFINDIVRDLFIGSLNSVYYNGGKRRYNYAFKSAFVSLPSKGGDDPLMQVSKEQGYPGPWYSKIDLDEFIEDSEIKPEMRHDVKTGDMFHYMFIFIEGTEKTKFQRQKMLDAGYTSRRAYNREVLNIHHFGFGEDRGILKEANFSKTDQPYLRESRYLEKGGDPFVQLSNVYNADIKAFGAPFFYPGQYVWITPYGLSKSRNTAYRLGSPDAGPTEEGSHLGRSVANLMGLGGYHIIISVEGILEDGLYEIRIEARHDNSGADRGERVGVLGETKRCADRDE